jgi:O-antigen/teichoic acid export membrane protein
MTATRVGGAARAETRPRRTADLAVRSTFATNVALAVLATATGVLSARLLHPTGEGELAAVQTWPLLLATLSMLGLDGALVYFIARQPERARQFTSTAVLIGLLSALALGAVAWFALPFALRAQPPQVVSAARVFLLIAGIYAVVGIPHGALRASHSFTAWNLFRVAPGLAWLCILLAFWFLGHPQAIPLSRWYLVGCLVCGLPFLILVNRKLQGPLRPDARVAPEMLRFGIPSAVTSVPLTINLQFDQMLIIAFLPARLLGLYAIAVSWSGGVAPALQAVGTVLFPHVSAERDTGRQGQLLATALQGGALIAVATAVPFLLLAPLGLPLVFGSGFAPSVPSALVLVPAGAILAWARIAEAGLQGLGRPTIVMIAEAVAAVVTVATLPVLIHFFGIFGAALASLIGYSTIAVFAVTAIKRTTNQGIRSLVIPTWPVARSLVVRSISLLPGRHRPPGRHRSPGAP